MPLFELQMPDGKTYEVDAPDMDTALQSIGQAPQAKQEPSMPWSDVPGQYLKNLPASAVEYGKNMVEMIRHPLQTYEGLGQGVRAMTDITRESIFPGMSKLTGKEPAPETQNISQALKERYGGLENIKRTIATDPFGATMDVATLLAGGGGAISRLGRVAPKTRYVPPRQIAKQLDVPKRSAFNVARDLPDDAARRASDMGDDAMMANLDPNLEGQAGRIASMDVAGAKTLRTVAEQQRARAGQRAEEVMDRSLGQATDRFTEKLGNRAVQKSQSPIYEIAKGRRINPKSVRWAITEAMESEIKPRAEFGELKDILKLPERDLLTGTFKKIDTDAGALVIARQRIDEMIRKEGTAQGNLGYSSYDKGKQTVLGVKLLKIRRAINDTLHSDSELAQADKIFADAATRTEAFDLGYTGAAGNMQPDELAYRLQNMPAQAQAEVVKGYRAKVDDVAGSIRPNRNEGATLLTQFNTPNQLEKQKILAGAQAADDIARAGKSERAIAGSATRIIGNSETARRLEFAKLYPSPNQGLPGASLAGYIGGGLGYSVGQIPGAILGATAGKALEGAANMIVSARRTNIANGAARLLSMTGGNRDAAIQALNAIKTRNLQPFAVRNADLIIHTLLAVQSSRAAGEVQQLNR